MSLWIIIALWAEARRLRGGYGSPERDVPLDGDEREAWDEIVSCWRKAAPEPQPRGQS